MGIGRLTPSRIRARYAKALKEIPLPVKSFTGIDPALLEIVAQTSIGDRTIRFGILTGMPRLWITVPDKVPPVLGFLTGLDTDSPELHLTELDHLDWVRVPGRAAHLKREALTAWHAAQRDCEG